MKFDYVYAANIVQLKPAVQSWLNTNIKPSTKITTCGCFHDESDGWYWWIVFS